MSIADLVRASGVVAPSTESVSLPARGRGGELKPGEASEFQKVFESQINFSKHAETRIRSREIEWSDQLQNRVAQGIDQAKEKGSRETLILADNVAVIANVKSRTVITAMDKSQLKEKIFTNIDSAVLV